VVEVVDLLVDNSVAEELIFFLYLFLFSRYYFCPKPNYQCTLSLVLVSLPSTLVFLSCVNGCVDLESHEWDFNLESRKSRLRPELPTPWLISPPVFPLRLCSPLFIVFLSPTLFLQQLWCPMVMTIILGAKRNAPKGLKTLPALPNPSAEPRVIWLGGDGAHGKGAHGRGQGVDPPLVGATRTEFVPGIGNVSVVSAAEEALQ